MPFIENIHVVFTWNEQFIAIDETKMYQSLTRTYYLLQSSKEATEKRTEN